MNWNHDYRNKEYKDAGVERGVTAKAMTAILALVLALVLTLTSCGTNAEVSSAVSSTSTTTASEKTEDNAASKAEMFTERDLSGDCDESEAVTISLNGTDAKTSSSDGVSVDGSTVTITAEGVYVVSGNLTDGQIVVNADDSAKVQIVLKGASVTSSNSAALYIKSADKVFVTLAAGTDNTLANGGSFAADGDTNIDGAVFAKDDITFNGNGSLTVTSPSGHGVVGKDDVKFAGGTYSITAAKHGVQANDSVRITGSDVTITSGNDKDGIHVSDDADAENGTESDSFFYMSDGNLTITSGDDGIHADAGVTIEGGSITVNESYEGIEGLSINISGGSTAVTAADDGLNAAGGNASSGSQTFGSDDWGGGNHGGFSDEGSDGSIVISGGTLKVTAGGDGIDSNGSVEITGGYTVVEGPAQGDTSVLDFNSSGTITGGTFIGTGGCGMAENFTSASQGVVAVSTGNQSAGSTVKLTDSSGDVIAETIPELGYAVVYVSTEDMVQGETYTLTAGSYSETITLSDIMYSTLSGGRGGSFGGGGPRGGMNDGQSDVLNGDMNNNSDNDANFGTDENMDYGMRGGHGSHSGKRGGMQGDMNNDFGYFPDDSLDSGNTPDGVTGASQLSDGIDA